MLHFDYLDVFSYTSRCSCLIQPVTAMLGLPGEVDLNSSVSGFSPFKKKKQTLLYDGPYFMFVYYLLSLFPLEFKFPVVSGLVCPAHLFLQYLRGLEENRHSINICIDECKAVQDR